MGLGLVKPRISSGTGVARYKGMKTRWIVVIEQWDTEERMSVEVEARTELRAIMAVSAMYDASVVSIEPLDA